MKKVWCRLCAGMFRHENIDADDLTSKYDLCCNGDSEDIKLDKPIECDFYEEFEVNK